jgi:hypothetical protein
MRSSLTFAVLGLAGALAVACGEDDFVPANGGAAGSGADAGADSEASGGAAGAGEAGAGGAPSAGPLDDPEKVRVWALTASALGVFTHLYEPLAFADGQRAFPDETCPVTSEADDVVTILGDCTDAIGDAWTGSVTVERSENGERVLTFYGYGHAFEAMVPNALTGTALVAEQGDGTHTFEVDLTHEGGVTTAIDYEGSVEGGYVGPTIWNGTGQIERQGSVEPTGVITATTVAQVFDDGVCSGQPISGTTTLEAGDQLAVVTYDGSSVCDADANARWSLDGEDRGTLSGIVCSIAHVGRPARAFGGAFATLALLGAFFACRRARRGKFGAGERLVK